VHEDLERSGTRHGATLRKEHARAGTVGKAKVGGTTVLTGTG
jgi:hypothetical protein